MKFSEQLMNALGEIDEDLIPSTEAQKSDKKRRTLRKQFTAGVTAAVLILAVFGAWHFIPREDKIVSEESVNPEPGELPMRYLYLFYLGSVEAADVWVSADFYPLTVSVWDSASPQIVTDVFAPPSVLFLDREGNRYELVTAYGGQESGTARRQLEIDLMYANYTHSYGCVLREVDWYASPARMRYLGICPLIREEDARKNLLAGNYITSVPDDLTAEGIREEQIVRAELIYLISPDENLLPMYYCFTVQLDPDSEGKTRYGLYYVLAATEEDAARLVEEAKFEG